jgi:hypothetical protein
LQLFARTFHFPSISERDLRVRAGALSRRTTEDGAGRIHACLSARLPFDALLPSPEYALQMRRERPKSPQSSKLSRTVTQLAALGSQLL